MDEDMIAGIIIMAATCFGCGALFFGIGIVARHSKKPFAFWAGTTVNPERVSDIAGYNRASARMWKWYSFPYFSAGILACLEPVSHVFAVLAAVLLHEQFTVKSVLGFALIALGTLLTVL